MISIGGSNRSATTAVDGSVTVTVPLSAAAGATSVTAAFAGDDSFQPAGATAPFTIARAASVLSPLTAQQPVVFAGESTGMTTTLTATVGGASQPLGQQTVTFSLAGAGAKTYSAITDYLGRVTLPSGDLAPGSYSVTAAFAGDATYLSSSVAGQLVVTLSRQGVLAAVTAERAAAGRRDRPELREAARRLADSLDPAYWVDAWHLSAKRGERVFEDDHEAVQSLRELLRDRKSGVADASIQLWIGALVTIDRRIAQVAIDDATAAGGNAKRLAEAARELAKAGDDLARGRQAEAIEHFASAWAKAVESLKQEPSKKGSSKSDD